MPTTLIEGRLYCLSRTSAPIKQLIAEASALYHKKSASRTTIRRPAPRQQRNDGNPWRTVARRPSRPLETVVLEREEKTRLILDIADYLKPDSRKWYAERGIPYRRGYVSLTATSLMDQTDFPSFCMARQARGKLLCPLQLRDTSASMSFASLSPNQLSPKKI